MFKREIFDSAGHVASRHSTRLLVHSKNICLLSRHLLGLDRERRVTKRKDVFAIQVRYDSGHFENTKCQFFDRTTFSHAIPGRCYRTLVVDLRHRFTDQYSF